MPAHPVELSPTTRTTAEHAGDAGRAWLERLPDLVAELEQRWSITVGEPLPGANEGFVARAQHSDGTDAVVKLMVPVPWPHDQIGTLIRADGRGYARVLAADEEEQAVLLEALGEPLNALGWGPDRTIDTLVDALQPAWTVPAPEGSAFQTGATKARALGEFIEGLWDQLGQPCSAAVIDLAKSYTKRRETAHDPDQSVWVHGDPNPRNALQINSTRVGAEAGFVFVDPEGLLAEPALDLGVILRDWDQELTADTDPAPLARRLCKRLAEAAGTDTDAVWEWGFIERVAIGLMLLDHEVPSGRTKLDIAEQLVTNR